MHAVMYKATCSHTTPTHAHTIKRSHAGKHNVTLCCVNLCLSLLLLLLLLPLFVSSLPTVHPFIPDPVIFWSISERRGEEGGRKISSKIFPSLLLSSPLSPSLLFATTKHSRNVFLYASLTLNPTWLHTCVKYMYTQPTQGVV